MIGSIKPVAVGAAIPNSDKLRTDARAKSVLRGTQSPRAPSKGTPAVCFLEVGLSSTHLSRLDQLDDLPSIGKPLIMEHDLPQSCRPSLLRVPPVTRRPSMAAGRRPPVATLRFNRSHLAAIGPHRPRE